MTDRELLELAAKAAGVDLKFGENEYPYYWKTADRTTHWNPLEDDGDALRLAVKLGMSISRDHCDCCIAVSDGKSVDWLEKINGDEYAATRRAVVRAAAEIGRSKE